MIITWNGPLTSLTMKIPAAVAAGNTVVVKPSELTPFAAELFADLIDEAGFPAAGRVAPRRGGACLWGPLAGGYFIEPTVFADVDPYSELAQTEVFGPVVAIIPFSTEQEALSIANSTAYGLSSYIQTNDLRRAHRMTERLQAGGTMINGAQNLMVNTIRRARPEWFRERGWPSRSRRILANQDDRNRTLTRSGKGSR